MTQTAAPPANDHTHVDLPMQTRMDVRLMPETVQDNARTIELVWSTGAAVRRRDFWTGKPYEEVLSLEPAHVDLARLNSGAPLLDAHDAFELAGVLGVVERAWIAREDDRLVGRAVVRFSDRDEVEPIWRDVRAGIIRNVSVGYTLNEVRVETPEKVGEVEKRIATRWTPHEISFVTVPADAGAQVRSADTMDLYPCIVTRSSSHAAALARMRMRQLGI